jgi:hypothetical protein
LQMAEQQQQQKRIEVRQGCLLGDVQHHTCFYGRKRTQHA